MRDYDPGSFIFIKCRAEIDQTSAFETHFVKFMWNLGKYKHWISYWYQPICEL